MNNNLILDEKMAEDFHRIYSKLEQVARGYLEYMIVFIIYNEENKKYGMITNSPLFLNSDKEVMIGLVDRCKEACNNNAKGPFSEDTIVRGDLRETLKGTRYTCMIYAFLIDILDREQINFVAESGIENSIEYLISILDYIRKDQPK